MVYAGAAPADAAVTRTGGIPLVPAEFSWPECRTCKGPMQFLAQVMPGDPGPDERPGVLSIFMCQNHPGLCDEWDASAGGNQAVIFPADGLTPAAVPAGGATMLGEVCAVRYVTAAEEYEQARADWSAREGRPLSDVLGQLGGQPSWVQDDQTPACPQCAGPMSLAVQLEEGHEFHTAINFGGGGCGYGFTCQSCAEAAFLWQR